MQENHNYLAVLTSLYSFLYNLHIMRFKPYLRLDKLICTVYIGYRRIVTFALKEHKKG